MVTSHGSALTPVAVNSQWKISELNNLDTMNQGAMREGDKRQKQQSYTKQDHKSKNTQ